MALLNVVPLYDVHRKQRKVKVYRERENILEKWDDNEFRRRFRFTKETFAYITDLTRNDLERTSGRHPTLSTEEQLALALRFYACGSMQEVLGDTISVHKSTVSRSVRDVSLSLCRLLDDFVCFPDDFAELSQIKAGFRKIAVSWGGWCN